VNTPNTPELDVVILGPEDGTAIDYRGARIVRKASRAQTAGDWAVGTGVQDAGFDNPLHTHEEAEAFFVVRGRYTFYSASGEVPATTGTFVFIPPGAPHGFRTEEDDSQLFCIWPATVERAFFGDD
jgi:quercetin dioxygenase-like cupin family protein